MNATHTSVYKRLLLLIFCSGLGLLWQACQPTDSTGTSKSDFLSFESSITDFHEALRKRETTIEALIQYYQDRIKTYDGDSTGLKLKSVIMLNPKALEEAREKDRNFSEELIKKYPLYGVPILIKDNINTQELPTSGGATALESNQPTRDAFIVHRLRKAGAIILGKANLSEFAFDYIGKSALGGQTKNAYDPSKGPGGSSSGTAVAVSSNFAMAGIGTDTGGSIRVPSALAGLVGLRPTMNLVSQNGVMPLSPWQDTAGPMCRNAEDCAILMEVMVGFDSLSAGNQRIRYQKHARLFNNNKEYQEVTHTAERYFNQLDSTALRGLRIGVVRDLFGTDSIAQNLVNPVIDSAITKMERNGAVIKEVTIRDLDTLLKTYTSMSKYEFKSALERYLNSWSVLQDHHFLTYQELLESKGYLKESLKNLQVRDSVDLNDLTTAQKHIYDKNTKERPTRLADVLQEAFGDTGEANPEMFDVLLYPSVIGLASALGKNTKAGKNNRLSSFSGFPAISFPAGMTRYEGVKVPVGVELLSRPFEESTLLNAAYAYEVSFHPRKAPEITKE